MGVPVFINIVMLVNAAQIKKEFFAYRNGIIADVLRKNGDPHVYIMGCQLVDVISIASRIDHTVEMASEMWTNVRHRECRMIAPMLFPHDAMTQSTALAWATSVESNEIADILCHQLLRNLVFASALARELVAHASPRVRYIGWRLYLNLLVAGKQTDKEEIISLIKKETAVQCPQDIMLIIDSIKEEL